MNRIDECFVKEGKKLITYTVAGYPDHESSLEIIDSIMSNGTDILELGIPFSDPVADGPVIQRAAEESIKNGFCLQKAFETVKHIRKKHESPVLFMLYFNTVYRSGIKQFIQKCKMSGIDGLVIPDLPFEDHSEVKTYAKNHEMNIISMISPTSGNRTAMIAREADNFIYCISSLGVTGKREGFGADILTLPDEIRKYTDKKSAVGFGISTPSQAHKLSEYYDGVIIGSALMEIIDKNGKKNSPAIAGEFISDIKRAIC